MLTGCKTTAQDALSDIAKPYYYSSVFTRFDIFALVFFFFGYRILPSLLCPVCRSLNLEPGFDLVLCLPIWICSPETVFIKPLNFTCILVCLISKCDTVHDIFA